MKIQTDQGIVDATAVLLRAGCFGGEEVVIALEKSFASIRRAHPGRVLYAWPEIPIVRDLRENNLEGLRIVHELKREFDGWIDPKGYEVIEPAPAKRCSDCGRPYTNSETARCLECDVLAKGIGCAS